VVLGTYVVSEHKLKFPVQDIQPIIAVTAPVTVALADVEVAPATIAIYPGRQVADVRVLLASKVIVEN